jgi:hypothetical protein
MTRSKKTDRLGITIEDHPFDIGYWRHFNGGKRTSCRSSEERKGFDACLDELKAERAHHAEDFDHA